MPDAGLNRRAVAFGAAFVVMVALVSLALRDGGSTSPGPPRDRITAGPAPGNEAGGPTRDRIPSSRTGVPADPDAAIGGLLAARGRAVMSGDRDAWLAPLARGSSAFRTDQGRVFGRIRSLTPSSWAYTLRTATALPAKQARRVPGGWTAEVDLTYQLSRGGPRVVRRQFLTVVPATTPTGTGTTGLGDWRIAGDSAGPTQPDLWDLGPVSVTRAGRCVVVSSTTRRTLGRRVTSSCTAAAQRVDAVWGRGWPTRTTLVIPQSQQQLATLLDRTGPASAGLDQTAAVTIGPATSAAEEVLINPVVFTEFPALGIRVVLTHELVHVATRATGSIDVPTWLAEGFADYVGFSSSGLGPRDIAGEALELVDRGRVPSALPPNGDFDSAGEGAAAAYGFSWAAIRVIAADGGTRRAVRFYRAVAAGSGSAGARVNRAVQRVLGLKDTRAFVTRWQRELRSLAG